MDSPEISALLDRYERPLVRYALSILRDLESARDVVQETFIRYVRAGGAGGVAPAIDEPTRADPSVNADSLHPPTPDRVAAWLFTVCRNRALDYHRKHSRIVPMNFPDNRATEEPSPAAYLESRDTAASLLQLVDSLSPNQREVIRLKFQSDLSYKEIAEITQLSVTNVGFLLHTGLKKLRVLLEESPTGDWPNSTASTRL